MARDFTVRVDRRAQLFDVEIGELAVGDRKSDFGVVDGIDFRDRIPAVYELALFDLFAADAPAIGRSDFGAGEVAVGAFESRFGFAQTRFRDLVGVFRVIDPRLARDGAPCQLLLALQFLVRSSVLACGAGNLRSCSFAIDAVIGGVDAREEFARLKKSATHEGGRHLDDFTRDLRNEFALGPGLDGAIGLHRKAVIGRGRNGDANQR